MGGNATFSGTTYQAGVIAFISVHIVTETKLRWLPVADDTPVAVSGEVKGPGDDARIEFGMGLAPIEVQAKHGLKGQKAIEEVFQAFRGSGLVGNNEPEIVLTLDPSSSSAIRIDLKRGLERLRSGREDLLEATLTKVLSSLGEEIRPVLLRSRIETVDVDPGGHDERRALDLLAENLEDPGAAKAAWSLLLSDAGYVCAGRLRRSRQDLVNILLAAGIRLLPPQRTRKWHDDLRHSGRLLENEEPTTALILLRQIEADLKSGSPDGRILYRLNQHKAAAYLQLGKFSEAIGHALKALDHDPIGEHALATLANAYDLNGDVEKAVAAAEKVVSLHPQSPFGWLVHSQVADSAGEVPSKTPPPTVTSTAEYRLGLLGICLSQGDAKRAQEISSELIREGNRSSRALVLRVDALLSDIDSVPAPERLDRAQEVERLCSEVLDGVADRSDRSSQRALVGRSVARRLFGRIEESQADIESAREIRPDDPNIITEAVQARFQAGDSQGAFNLLNHPIVDGFPFLKVMRASAFAERGDTANAKKDLDAVLQNIASSPKTDLLRSASAEVAIALGDVPLARRLLSETADQFRVSAHYILLMARIALVNGDLELAGQKYREAGQLDPAHRAEFLAELASKFLLSNRAEEAVQVFQEAQPLPRSAQRPFAQALIETDRLAEAQRVIDGAAFGGSMPDWAVAYAANIALRRNDPTEASVQLEALIARGSVGADARLTLIETLLSLELRDRAAPHVALLCQDEELSPRDRLRLARVLNRTGQPKEAIAMGLRAYREAPHDPEISRAFAGTVMMAKTRPSEADRVGPDTHVVLKSREGKDLEYVIFSTTLPNRMAKEISIEVASATGLIDLRVGDEFVQDPGSWLEKKWLIVEIEPVIKYLFNDVLTNYSTRFPAEPFFVANFHLNPAAPSIADLQPMIESARDRDRRQETVLSLYREEVLPLDSVAGLLGVSVPDVIGYISRPESGLPVFVEWSDDEGGRMSRDTARTAHTVVLSRATLVTIQAFDLLEIVAKKFRCRAARALRDQIRTELAEADQRVRDGHMVIGAGEAGLVVQRLEAGDPTLVRAQERLRSLLTWMDESVHVMARPLAAFGDPRPRGDEVRERLGECAYDSVELALHADGVLYADDLGLRRIASGMGARSFSTISMLQVLSELGDISSEQRDKSLVDLVERHYISVPVSAELISEALSPLRSANAVKETMTLLSAPGMDLERSARILVSAIKCESLRSVQRQSVENVTRYGLTGMSHRFVRVAAVKVVVRVAEEELALMPAALLALKQACVSFLRKAP
jgi:tetratricopeptide (TPR) repeat protein